MSERLTPADGLAYWHALKPTEPAAWPEHDPAPEVTTLDPRPADAPDEPRAVRLLVAEATAAGWQARVGYSRGPIRAVKVGTYKTVECFGVWASEHPETGWRFCAMHERTIGAATGWKWARVTMWHARGKATTGGALRFSHANRTDLSTFIELRGLVLPSWFAAIEKRVVEQAERQKAAAKKRPRKTENGA